MSMINKEISDFTVQAYLNNEFKAVTKEDVLGNGVYFSFIQRISPLCALRSWKI